VVEVGGGLRTYSAAGRPVVDGYAADEICSSGRGQLLLPWPNRIEDGRYEFDGVGYQLPLDEPERRNAIHGLVRWSRWRVAERSDRSVTLDYLLDPRPGYPFALELRAEYGLEADGLTVRMQATNVGDAPCPYGAGAHPYLTVEGGCVDDVSLRVPASTVLDADERGLPVGARPVESAELDFRSAKTVGKVQLDHCFTDVDRDADGRVRVQIGRTALWADQSFAYLMVFTGDGLADVDRRSIAVEPMTCAPNAFRSGDGLVRLAPGDTHSGSWGISARPS
jgi:aldose 1-epimerase